MGKTGFQPTGFPVPISPKNQSSETHEIHPKNKLKMNRFSTKPELFAGTVLIVKLLAIFLYFTCMVIS